MPYRSVPAIETKSLVKVFGAHRAVDRIDLIVPAGMIYGLLGLNGAGKTTVIRMLATLLKPGGGSAFVLGHDVVQEPDEVRRRSSLTGQFASVDEELTGYEELMLLARLLGFKRSAARARTRELLKLLEIEDAADRQVKNYSGGMRRRLDIAASILRTPDLLFLDEPTTGLDPYSRNRVWDMIRELVAGGTSVLLTTQYLEEADQLADRIAVIDRGTLIAEGTSADLKAQVGRGVLHVRLTDADRRDEACRLIADYLGDAVHVDGDPRALTVQLSQPNRAPSALVVLAEAGISVSGFSLGQPSLDEVFFSLTGHAATTEIDTEETDNSLVSTNDRNHR